MAEDKVEPREVNWRQLMPWTVLFQGFRVALDPNKLVLAAAGILAMALGWWGWSIVFDYKKPKLDDWNLADFTKAKDDEEREAQRWQKFKDERDKWHVMHRAAGTAFPNKEERDQFAYDAGDLADSRAEYDALVKAASAKEDVQIPGMAGYGATMTRAQVQQFIKSVPVSERDA